MKMETLVALTSYLDIDVRKGSGGAPQTDAAKMVAMTISFLGCATGYQQMSVLFGVTEDIFIRCTEKVIAKLIEKSEKLIQFPNKDELHNAAKDFDDMGTGHYFPNTVGAVDSMHLRVEVKEHQRVAYYNYLHWHNIHLQGIADAHRNFLDVFVGWPGRAHDAVVWKKSLICEHLQKLLYVVGRSLVNTYHLVGDTAYPCSNDIMTPFKVYGGVISAAKKI